MHGLEAGLLGTMKSCKFFRVFLWRFISKEDVCITLGMAEGRDSALRLLCEGPSSALLCGRGCLLDRNSFMEVDGTLNLRQPI